MKIDLIGIFLPPQELFSAREDAGNGRIDCNRLTVVEDRVILDVVKRQLAAGIKYVTSGNVRWKHWDMDFFFGHSGIVKERLESGHIYSREDVMTDLLHINGRISFNPEHPCFSDFSFLKNSVGDRAVCRQIMPSPAELFVRVLLMGDGHPEKLYPAPESLTDDIAGAYRKTIGHLYELGCRSIVFDDTVCGRFCEDYFVKRLLQGGIDVIGLQDEVIGIINDSLAGLPSDMETALYLSGGDIVVPRWEHTRYADNIVPRILSETAVGMFFMPFNACDDHALRILEHVPEGKKVVLGLVDSHSPFPDNADAIEYTVSKAMQIISPDKLAIGPRTGFGLTSFASRGLSYNDQWAKIESLKKIAGTLGRNIEQGILQEFE